MPEKFIVPQFIDNEDKILGPITVRQFLICLVATLVIFIEYKLLRTPYFIAALIPTGGLSAVFAFLKVNGQPFHLFFVNVLQTMMRPGLRVWNKNLNDAEIRALAKREEEAPIVKRERKAPPSSTRLRDLALTVNTGGVYNPDQE